MSISFKELFNTNLSSSEKVVVSNFENKMKEKSIKEQIALEKNFLIELFKKYTIFLKEQGNDLTTVKNEVLSVLSDAIEKYNIGSSSIVSDMKKFILKQFMSTTTNAKEDIAKDLNVDCKMIDGFVIGMPELFDNINGNFANKFK